MWGLMGCRDRLQQSMSPAQPGPGASAGREKLVDTRRRSLVSPLLLEPCSRAGAACRDVETRWLLRDAGR